MANALLQKWPFRNKTDTTELKDLLCCFDGSCAAIQVQSFE